MPTPPPTPTTYNITYDLDGGINNIGNPATFVEDDLDITLLDPTKGGYVFLNWTTDEAGNNPISTITVAADITIYAQFDPE